MGDAFDGLDENGDGKLSPKEIVEGGKRFKKPVTTKDGEKVAKDKELDKDGSKDVSPEEWNEAMGGCPICDDEFEPDGITVPELKKRAKKKHDTPKKAFEAFDKGDPD